MRGTTATVEFHEHEDSRIVSQLHSDVSTDASLGGAYLKVEGLSKVYATDDGPVRALDRVTLTQRKGEFVSLVGPSGCGKSTLMMIAAGLASASDGEVLVENKRVITLIDSPVFGPVAMIEVGATNVGSIQQSFVPGRAVEKGEEKGFFSYGGSCVITLFGAGRLRFDSDVVEQSHGCMETYARMGDRLGEAG